MLILYRVLIQLIVCVCIVNARLFLLQPQNIVNLFLAESTQLNVKKFIICQEIMLILLKQQ